MVRVHSQKMVVLQHETFERPGVIQKWAETRGYEVEILHVPQIQEWPILSAHDVLVVMGGSMGVHDEDQFPWLAAEKFFLRQAIAKRTRILGVCLGAQLLALVLGGQVFRGPTREIGWMPVLISKAGQKKWGLPESWMVFHWHGDHIRLPFGAVLWAKSRLCPVQIFTWREHILGLQCHPEMDDEIIDGIIRADPLPDDHNEPGVQSLKEIMAGKSNLPRLEQKLHGILDKFFIE